MAQKQDTQVSMYCRKCGYALAYLVEQRCPECGSAFDPSNEKTYLHHAASWSRRRLAKRIATIVLTSVLLGVVGLAGYCFWAKAVPDLYCSYGTRMAYYRGLGLPGADGLLGRHWTSVTYVSPDYPGIWRFECTRDGYNHFRGFYPDGRLREEGECWVGGTSDGLPSPQVNRLKHGRCYRPDGALASEVVDGTGIRTIWTSSGTKVMELELREQERVRLAQWYSNGQPKSVQTFADGRLNGPYTYYDASGNKVLEGAYERGKRVGKWINYYNPDGKVRSTDVYDIPSEPGR